MVFDSLAMLEIIHAGPVKICWLCRDASVLTVLIAVMLCAKTPLKGSFNRLRSMNFSLHFAFTVWAEN